MLIDEWQLVPEVLPAVKRVVDSTGGANRFILTGSSQADLTTQGWAATGRVIRGSMWGLTQRELLGNGDAGPFLDRLVENGMDAIKPDSAGPIWRPTSISP